MGLFTLDTFTCDAEGEREAIRVYCLREREAIRVYCLRADTEAMVTITVH